nr:SRPBCC family protein [Candidatus Sigynarchaeota archaeon]
MVESLKMSTTLLASPKEIYEAWLDSKKHGAMTGSPAVVDPSIGGQFSAWDGYIEGKTIELEPNQRIVQAWRTSDFPEGSPDSTVEITLEEASTGTKVTLVHANIPDGQSEQYKDGWNEFYFGPMKAYFKKKRTTAGKKKK